MLGDAEAFGDDAGLADVEALGVVLGVAFGLAFGLALIEAAGVAETVADGEASKLGSGLTNTIRADSLSSASGEIVAEFRLAKNKAPPPTNANTTRIETTMRTTVFLG
ncbi:MAG: hypothetical protein UV59_C0037G0013 [Candidatus Gottesmanbacteria bacterium GW2011_GWA1_43_11]|uniref:Uncharacterized protein n=1 Tax=Candidatus Gottesmanbacteria bacterium GW2011_GWA1_43_11 TaxID=1618436 RepID=A0A0G1CDN8_9BACT|nr:MAG: hypothetical protein UV59_C0037G0013 [Candidatus Gottesmanbacteria bacterium GW2011_GWA1_43_11]